jgi:drug/metabolite transporter (DMT)-like permease
MVEQFLPSALVAILVSAAPLWFVVLDKSHWRENFTSPSTLTGLLIGFVGVIVLFYEKVLTSFHTGSQASEVLSLALLIGGSIAWAGGSLYSKAHSSSSSASVSTVWQMFSGGIAFFIAAGLSNEFSTFHWQDVPPAAWYSCFFLVIFGSIAAFSAYVWLLQIKPATQVSTYAYVNPVVAVLLGVLFAQEKISWLQISGLFIILLSVLLINIAKYRSKKVVELG